MNVQDFLSEWDAIRANSGLTNPEMQMTALMQWVILRKDIAAQEAKNEWWASFIQGIIDALREQLSKLTPEQKKEPGVETIQEMMSKLEAAMAKHRKMHGQDDGN